MTAGAPKYGRPSHSNQQSSTGTIIEDTLKQGVTRHNLITGGETGDQETGGGGSGIFPPPAPEPSTSVDITFLEGGGFSVAKKSTQPKGEQPKGTQSASTITGTAESPPGGQDAVIKNEKYRTQDTDPSDRDHQAASAPQRGQQAAYGEMQRQWGVSN